MAAGMIALVTLVAFAFWWAGVQRHAIRRCQWCNGSGKNAGSSSQRWGTSGRCGGCGNLRRRGAGKEPR
jgi:hypothetical protein